MRTVKRITFCVTDAVRCSFPPLWWAQLRLGGELLGCLLGRHGVCTHLGGAAGIELVTIEMEHQGRPQSSRGHTGQTLPALSSVTDK